MFDRACRSTHHCLVLLLAVKSSFEVLELLLCIIYIWCISKVGGVGCLYGRLRIIIHRSTFCLCSLDGFLSFATQHQFPLEFSLFLFVIYLRSDEMRGNQGGTLPGRRDNITPKPGALCAPMEMKPFFFFSFLPFIYIFIFSTPFCPRLLNARFFRSATNRLVGSRTANQVSSPFIIVKRHRVRFWPFLSFQVLRRK